jgi:hypothetical protein
MKRNREISINQILMGVAIIFILVVCLSFFHRDPIPMILGIVFGLTLSLLNFRLLYIALNKAVKLPTEKAKVYASSRYMIRYIFTAVCLYISIKAPYINILGTILGLIILKLAILLSNSLNTKDLLKRI